MTINCQRFRGREKCMRRRRGKYVVRIIDGWSQVTGSLRKPSVSGYIQVKLLDIQTIEGYFLVKKQIRHIFFTNE